MSKKDEVKKRKQEKKKFELTYLRERIVDYLAFLESNPIEHSSLAYSLDSVLDDIDYAFKLLDGYVPWKLPEGLREKMEPALIESFAEGKDYGGYLYEQSEIEIDEMDDEEFYNNYVDCFWNEDEDEQDQYIQIVEDIKAKEELEEAINE